MKKFIILLLAALVGYLLAHGLPDWLRNRSAESQKVETRLEAISKEVNKTCPTMLDQDTELTTTFAAGNMLVYTYQIHKSGELDPRAFEEYRRKDITFLCTTPETRELLDQGATLRYAFHNLDGAYLGQFDVHSSDCRERPKR